MTAADLAVVSAEVDRARAAGEFQASSDADATFLLQSLALDPTTAACAFEDGEVVGFASGEFKIVIVRPDRRRAGIGRRLVAFTRLMERERGRDQLILGCLPDDEVGRAFLEATGFSFHSTLWDLEIPAERAVPEPLWPVGLTARPFAGAEDVAPWVELFNVAFADHATPLQLDASFVIAGLDDPAVDDRDLLLVADTASGQLVGFCATAPIRRDGRVEPRAEIWTVGVRPGNQGAGLGRQLLRWGVGYLRSLAIPRIDLSVNGRNERALGLYESEGFVRVRTRERWAQAVG